MFQPLKKYLHLVNIHMQASMAYKFPFFVTVAIPALPVFAKFYLWKAVYGSCEQGTILSGFSLNDMVTYFILYQFVSAIAYSYVHYALIPDIQNGRLTSFLPIPVYYPLYRACIWFGGGFFARSISNLLLYPIIMIILHQYITLKLSIIHITMGIAAVLLGKALFYAFHGCIGMMGFWLESEPPLLLLAVSFICGEYLPIALMPSGMQKLIAYLPFKYTIYLPVQIFLGKVDVITALSGILIQIGWIAFFTIILHVLYLFGIRRYQAFGG